MRAFPSIRDLATDVSWNFRVKTKIKKFNPRKPDAPDGTWRMQQEDIDRVQEFRKCIECFLCQDVCHVLRDHHKHDEFIGPRFLVYTAALEMHPLDTEDRLPELQAGARHRLLQHHQVLHQGLPGTHHHHRQRHHPAQGTRGGRLLRSVRLALEEAPTERLDRAHLVGRRCRAAGRRGTPVLLFARWAIAGAAADRQVSPTCPVDPSGALSRSGAPGFIPRPATNSPAGFPECAR